MNIQYNKKALSQKPQFSIIIPTWNNLEFLKLCIESIREHSQYFHQIIVHVNEGNDGTLEWLDENQIDHSYSKENIGICLGCNAAAGLSEADYIMYLNDDMYVCPEWDHYLMEEIKSYGKNNFYFSSTMIEPRPSGNACVISPYDFGTSPLQFKKQDLLNSFKKLSTIKKNWSGSTWPPSIMHKEYWNLIGGFSIEFSPGFYSDPDISRKMWDAGCRNFKGIGKSLVYHFMSKSTGKLKKHNPGRKTFMKKWGISPGFFLNKYLHIGEDYSSILTQPEGVKKEKFKTRLKSLFS